VDLLILEQVHLEEAHLTEAQAPKVDLEEVHLDLEWAEEFVVGTHLWLDFQWASILLDMDWIMTHFQKIAWMTALVHVLLLFTQEDKAWVALSETS